MSSPVEQIKSRLNIVDVVGSYIKLQKAGINLKAACPFHKEKSPSFFVSPSRETWHCFGCNKGGDMFNFVMEIEGVEFYDALKILAEKAGVEITPMGSGYKSERSRFLNLLNDAKIFYENELVKNEKAFAYLKERGLKETTIKEFGIGFAPDGWRNIHSFLTNKGYNDSEMEKTGMVIKSEKGFYDRFRSRIMFPLFNSAGQIVGFSGRIFGKEDEAVGGKYINSPQTELYDKSKLLYGFDKAKTEIRKNDLCILVEGQMDVIMSHQAEIKNTVAVSGTALTLEHLMIIKRLTNNLAMAFDSDDAGFAASKRGIDMALAEDFEVRAISISSGKDPADAIREDKKIWEDAVKGSKNIIDFLLETLSEKIKDPRDLKKSIEKNVLHYVALISSEIEKAHWVGEIAKRLGIKDEPIWEQLKKEKNPEFNLPENSSQTVSAIPHLSRLDFLREKLRGFLLWQKDTKDKELKQIMEDFSKKFAIDLNIDKEEAKKDIFEAEIFYSGISDLKKELENIGREFEKEEIKFQLGEITMQIRKLEMSGSASEEELKESLNKFYELTKKLNEIKK